MQFLGTVRIGQISGSNNASNDPDLAKAHDPQFLPLLNDTSRWGALGFDEGANTDHDGRLYFFPGDVKCRNSLLNPLNNSHLVAWTEDRTILPHGGHRSAGFNFLLPHEVVESANNQANWRYCVQCGGLFFAGYEDKHFQNVCQKGGSHIPAGFNFVLPHEVVENAHNQANWRYCVKCGGLFFGGYQNVCPKGGSHIPAGFNFVLPHDAAEDANNQANWRYCVGCGGLFWDGSSHLGLCPGASGGGFHLQAVLRNGSFWPFEAGDPVGVTLSLEPPVSAFSYGGRVYVFTGVGAPHWSGQTRPGDPTYGRYLVSTDQPDQPHAYRTEFLFNPKIGVCPADGGSHSVLGHSFVLPHDVPADPQSDFNWFRCKKCASLFHSEVGLASGVCRAGDLHEAGASPNYAIAHDHGEDALNQGQWRRCRKCQTMFWSGYFPDQGICPEDGLGHESADQTNFVLPHDQPEDSNHVASWRRCKKCAVLFWDGLWTKGSCAASNKGHDAIGNEAADPAAALQNEVILTHSAPADSNHEANWHLCTKCLGLFFDDTDPFAQTACPVDHRAHSSDYTWVPHLPGRIEPPVGYDFVLPHDLPEDRWHEAGWRRCTKCSLLFSYLNFSDLYFEEWTVPDQAPAAGDPATMVTDGQQHIFYRGTDGDIHHIFWNAADNTFYRQSWTALANAPPNARRAAGDPATMLTDGQQHIFYRDAHGAINHIFWNAADNKFYFESWTERVNAPPATGDPVTMVTPGQQHIFYRGKDRAGTDGIIYHIFWNAADNGLYLQSWTALANAPLAAGDPAAMLTDGQQHIFYRDAHGAINHIFWNAADNNFYFESWTARVNAPFAAGDPATMVTPGQQHIFYRSKNDDPGRTDGPINHIFWNAADNGLYLQSWTALANAPLAAGDPATMLTDGQQHIFYRSADGAINHIFWTPGTGLPVFQDWTALAPHALPAEGDPATMLTDGQQHVFYRGTDDINQIFWIATCTAGGTHSPSAKQFIPPRRIRQDPHNDRDWRFCTKCFGLVYTKAEEKFWTVDSAVVHNADFPNIFPTGTGDGVVIIGYGWSDFFLAWMPLGPAGPRLQDTLYYSRPDWDEVHPKHWRPNVDEATGLFGAGNLSDANRISLAWLEGPKQWILLYGRPDAVIARVGPTLWTLSDEIPIISRNSPDTAGELYSWVDPGSWPYGPSLLKRFTEWDPTTRVLGIYYLISLSTGYQVHLMRTRLQL